ncbi:glycoside hydrolase family 88 protein [Uliginosibacterium sp. sgz301328]|uniref:glycoside hydrolase family 88 protein n=1 Tax=Uliginosibacterium sp. sgz301328 TaxID=3243764 RepID=UPI00359DBCB9
MANAVFRQVSMQEAFEYVEQQVLRLLERAPDQFPAYTERGIWVFADDPWAPNWSSGFLAGLIWAIAQRSGDGKWVDRASRYCRLIEPRKHDDGTHDIGFIFEPSWGRWYDHTPTPHARAVLIEAGRTMAARFQQPGGYLRTWVDAGSTFIDVMMNVGVIFRAAEYSGDAALFEVALAHSRTSRRHLQRGDGSTLHEGWFDPATGEFLRAATHQGWRPDSTWARGQAWAIYGFTTAYKHSRADDMLDSACHAADYYIAQTPEHVPPNDWLEPAPHQQYESSAAAIAAAGMLHLANALGGTPRAAKYRSYGLAILARLLSSEFLAVDRPEWEGIVLHSTYHRRNGLGVDESVMWAGYYLIEAMELAAEG